MARITDVARQAGVSPATVSRVLNRPDLVTPEKRDRVLAAVKSLDYSPNALASGLRAGAVRTVALLVGDISQPFQGAFAKAISRHGEALGYRVLLCDLDQSEERRLYDHYGLGYSETDSGSGLPAEHEERPAGPTPGAWGSEQQAAEPDPWGADEPKPDPWEKPEAEESSWSAVADPSNLAPDPAEPPSVEELEAADLPEPAVVSEDFAAPATPETEDLKAQPGPIRHGVHQGGRLLDQFDNSGTISQPPQRI